ncbi:MAG: C25 family cysteine peptidase [Pyrinomonadaceae bacterium]
MKKVSFALAALSLILSAGFSASAQKIKSTGKTFETDARVRVEKSPVKFAKLEAYTDGQGVWLNWQMAVETNNLGFTVNRARGKSEAGVTVNAGLISGAYLELGEASATNRKYSYYDAAGDSNSTYTIETINLNGERSGSRRISVQTIADISALAGASSGAMKAAAASAKPITESAVNDLPSDLKSEVAQNAPQADAARQLWVAAQPGVKIGVRDDGFYRVTRAQLQTGGFDVNAPTALWQLYANGVEQSINVDANGDYIEFYGRGIDTSESDTQSYYLLVGDTNGRRIGTTYRRQIGGRILSAGFAQTYVKKERFVYSSNFLNGDAENFFGTLVTNSGAVVNPYLSGVDFSTPNTGIDLTIQGLTTTAHQTVVALNGHELGTINFEGRNSATVHYDVPTAYLAEGGNGLRLTTLGSGDIILFDTIKVNYRHKYRVEGKSLLFFTQNYRATYVENFSSPNVRIFDITNAENPSVISGLSVEPNNGTYRVYLPSYRGRVMFAVEDSGFYTATVSPNTPSTLTTTNHNADLVIITYKTWASQANDWAAYRRAQGMSVEVVNVEDIYDEYSFGALSSLSIRNFLQYAVSNWQTAPKYVLLIGDATYDPKNYTHNGYNSFIPTRLVDTVYTESGSDDWLADFNGDGLTELAIGRIPARDGAFVAQQLAKATAFEAALAANGLTQRGAIFASDVPNGYDFQGLSERVRQQLPQTVSSVAINRAEADAPTRLVSEINTGRFTVNYSGHGTTNGWNGFFGNTNALALTNDNLSIFTMLTCLNGYFISPYQDTASQSLSEALLASDKGAVASWASSGLTTPDVQEVMATRFYQQLGSAGNTMRLGDLVKDAKTEISYGRDVRLSWVLLGDPTLKVK